MNSKQGRRARIKQLLQSQVIDTHEKLASALRGQKVGVSQSTLSKDLREMGVVRLPLGEGGYRYALPHSGGTLRDRNILQQVLQDYLTGIAEAGNLLVLKTLPGHAQSLCESIDRSGWTEIVGTIAGENTIFIATRNAEEAERVNSRIDIMAGQN